MRSDFELQLRIEPHNRNQRAPLDYGAARRRRFALNDRAAKQRQAAYLTLLAEVPRRARAELVADNERLVVTLTRVGPGTMDDDGLAAAFKPVRDGLTDALGFKSDAHPRLRWLYGQQRGGRGEYSARVRLETMSSADFGQLLARAEAATA